MSHQNLCPANRCVYAYTGTYRVATQKHWWKPESYRQKNICTHPNTLPSSSGVGWARVGARTRYDWSNIIFKVFFSPKFVDFGFHWVCCCNYEIVDIISVKANELNLIFCKFSCFFLIQNVLRKSSNIIPCRNFLCYICIHILFPSWQVFFCVLSN